MPRIEGNAIVCGNKRLDLRNDSGMTLSCDGEVMGRFFYYFTGEDKATKSSTGSNAVAGLQTRKNPLSGKWEILSLPTRS